MRTRPINEHRVSPYVVPTRALNTLIGQFAGVKVKEAVSHGWARAKEMAYMTLKAAPLIYLAAPNPITGAFAVVSGIDTLLKVRNGDKVGLLEAILLVGSCVHSAAAQTFKYAGNDKLLATSGNSTAQIDCDSHYAFRSSTPTNSSISQDPLSLTNNSRYANGSDWTPVNNSSNRYESCALRQPIGVTPYALADLPNVPALPIPAEQMEAHCQAAYSECYPEVNFNYVGSNKLQANSTRTSNIIDCKSDAAFSSQTVLPVIDFDPDTAPIYYSNCDLKTGSVSAVNQTDLATTPVLPIPMSEMPSQCVKAFDACASGTEPTSTTSTTTTPTGAIPEGSPGFSKVALGVGLGGGGLLVGGVVSAVAYSQYRKHNHPDRSQIYQVNPMNITPSELGLTVEDLFHYEGITPTEINISLEKEGIYEDQSTV